MQTAAKPRAVSKRSACESPQHQVITNKVRTKGCVFHRDDDRFAKRVCPACFQMAGVSSSCRLSMNDLASGFEFFAVFTLMSRFLQLNVW